MSRPSTRISCFIGLASCGFMVSPRVKSLLLIEIDPHRGGSISLILCAAPTCVLPQCGCLCLGAPHRILMSHLMHEMSLNAPAGPGLSYGPTPQWHDFR